MFPPRRCPRRQAACRCEGGSRSTGCRAVLGGRGRARSMILRSFDPGASLRHARQAEKIDVDHAPPDIRRAGAGDATRQAVHATGRIDHHEMPPVATRQRPACGRQRLDESLARRRAAPQARDQLFEPSRQKSAAEPTRASAKLSVGSLPSSVRTALMEPPSASRPGHLYRRGQGGMHPPLPGCGRGRRRIVPGIAGPARARHDTIGVGLLPQREMPVDDLVIGPTLPLPCSANAAYAEKSRQLDRAPKRTAQERKLGCPRY